jgi:hypothetical protein
MEDELGADDNLAHAAQKLSLNIQKIGPADISGKLANGDEINAAINNRELFQKIFTTPLGATTPMIEQSGGFIIAAVDEIVPVSQKEFANVKNTLMQIWTAKKQQEKMKSTVADVIERAENGTALETQGVFANYKRLSEKSISHTSFGALPEGAVETIFMTPQGKVASLNIGPDTLIFVTTKIISADSKKDAAGFAITKQNLKNTTGTEIANAVMNAYAKKYGVKTDEAAILSGFSVYNTQE